MMDKMTEFIGFAWSVTVVTVAVFVLLHDWYGIAGWGIILLALTSRLRRDSQ